MVDVDVKVSPTFSGRPASSFDGSSFLSRWSFSFVNKFISKGIKAPLTDAVMDALPSGTDVVTITDSLEKEWLKEVDLKRYSLWRALYRFEFCWFWSSALHAFLESACRIGQPVLLGALLSWITDKTHTELDPAEGFGLAAALIATSLIQVWVHHALYYFTMFSGCKARIAMSGLLHRKLLKVHSSAVQSTGRIINLVSNDVMRFDNFYPRLHFAWTGPLDIVVVFGLLCVKVGIVATICGCAILFVSLPLQLYFGKRFAKQRSITANLTDERVRCAREVFSGILAVKAGAWEPYLEVRNSQLRQRERRSILKSMTMKAINLALNFSTPYVATLLTILSFWALGNTLDISVVFSTMALIHVLRVSMGKNLAMALESGPEAVTSMKRFVRFLRLPEKLRAVKEKDEELNCAISLQDCTFSFSPTPNPTQFSLRAINLTVDTGSLVAVVGKTGAGKTTLLRSILGEMNTTAGCAVYALATLHTPLKSHGYNSARFVTIYFGESLLTKRGTSKSYVHALLRLTLRY